MSSNATPASRVVHGQHCNCHTCRVVVHLCGACGHGTIGRVSDRPACESCALNARHA